MSYDEEKGQASRTNTDTASKSQEQRSEAFAACVIFGLVGVLFLTFHIIEMTFQDWSSIDTQQINRTVEGMLNVMWYKMRQDGVSPEQLTEWFNKGL